MARTVTKGEKVTFTVAATGTAPLSFQWSGKGVAIPGATAPSLTINPTRASDAGNYSVTVSNAMGTAVSSNAALTILTPIYWRKTNGLVSVWLMNGTNISLAKTLNGSTPVQTEWRLIGVSDFDRDSQTDLLWQNNNGVLAIWFMKGTNRFSTGLLLEGRSVSPQLHLVGLTDFNHDRQTDLLWQHSDGHLEAWLLNEDETAVTNTVNLQNGQAVPVGWRFKAVSDFNQDNNADFLWQNDDGRIAIWQMDGTNLLGRTLISKAVASSGWEIAGANDFNADGETDILWKHADGRLAVWFMEGTSILRSLPLRNLQPIASAWQAVPVGFTPFEAAPQEEPAPEEIDWPDLNFTLVTSGVEYPTHVTHAGDGSGRLFATEQRGRIRVIEDGVLSPTPFLDITNQTTLDYERGLLSVAFPPGFSTNRHFYVCYTRSSDGAVAISRFSVATNSVVADPSSEQQILVIPHGDAANHNGGQLAFGPDGYLYISVGDGGATPQYAQTGTNLLGKILRIDVESSPVGYQVPTNNPLVSNSSFRPEIWAFGLRNPWRFSFDRVTGDLYIGDVGSAYREEIDFQPAGSTGGQNYGWPLREGSYVWSSETNGIFTDPVTEQVGDYGRAITGGFVVRCNQTNRLNGKYIFGEWGGTRVWGLKQFGTNWHKSQLTSNLPQDDYYGATTFGEDEAGNLYRAGHSGGNIYRIEDSNKANRPQFEPPITLNYDETFYYKDSISVQSSPGSVLHYTTNGIDPTLADPSINSGETITVTNGMTVKAQAFRSDLLPSEVSSNICSVRVMPPQCTPSEGIVTNGTYVSVTCATPGAIIYYTLDGSEPTTNSPIYKFPLCINGNTTLRTVGIKPGLASSITSVFYPWASVDTPVITPPSGPITNRTPITITCSTPEAAIFFTLDGSNPTKKSIKYTGPLIINGNTRVRAKGYKNNYKPSQEQDVFFNLIPVDVPIFSPPPGRVSNGTPVTISCSTPGATIRYTLNGSEPSSNSPIYSEPIILSRARTISAKAFKPGYTPSLQSAYYSLIILEKTVVTTIAGNGSPGFRDGNGILAQFSSPNALCMDSSGAIYVSDTVNDRIRKILPSGEVTTLAGSGIHASQDGQGTNAGFAHPFGVAIDKFGYVYTVDTYPTTIRKISPNGNVSTLASLSGAPHYSQIEVDSGGTVFAGAGERFYLAVYKTNGITSYFDGPDTGHTGVGLDAFENIFVTTGGRLAKVNQLGAIEYFTGGGPTVTDGPRLQARFANPLDCTFDAQGNIYIGDDTWVRKVGANGMVSTLAGTGIPGHANGPGDLAQFSYASGICTDPKGNVYVTDSGNHCIRRISIDSDSDGIPDFEETSSSGFVVGVDDREVDSDGDDQSNADEYRAGTDPLSAVSHL